MVTVTLFMLLLTVSCAPAGVDIAGGPERETGSSYQSCYSGATLYNVNVDNQGGDLFGRVYAFVLVPKEGCNLPVLYCTLSSYDQGLGGCVKLDD